MSPLLSLFLLISFPKIGETLPDGPFSYPGQSKREVIVVDPDHSPLLQKGYEELKLKLEKDLLLSTLQYVQEELFARESCTEENLRTLLSAFENNGMDQNISLEVFLEEKTGVCRHIALTTTYLLDRLIKEGLMQGEVYLIRDETPFGRHAWTLFLTKDTAWHLDAYWGILEDGKTRAGFSNLCKKYGKRTMDRQKTRWENGD